jgi:hypothetical protein
MGPAYISISDHSPILGRPQIEIRNPDARDSLQAETDDRRFFDKQANIRIDKLIRELGSTTDLVNLLSENIDQLSRDIAAERDKRLVEERRLENVIELSNIEISLLHDKERTSYAQISSLEERVLQLEAKTWWSMFIESVKSIVERVRG